MPDGFEPAYIYARVCGSLARSYLGARAAGLASSHRVGEAWRAIFGEAPPAMPESELATAAELGIRSRAYEATRRIAGNLAQHDPFLSALLRKWEFAYVKSLLSAIVEGAPEAPSVDDGRLTLSLGLRLVPSFAVGPYPKLDAMLSGTRYAWVVDTGLDDLPGVKNKLDRQYYAELWDSAKALPARLAGSVTDLIRVEVELENVIWGLRLKRYYSMDAAQIEALLIALPGADVKSSAQRAIGLRADSRSEWADWSWESLVPDSGRDDGGDWYLDLRGLESAASVYLFRKLYRRLHLEPDCYVPLYSYFRIKEFEARALCGIIEGIRLEAPAAEIASFAAKTTGERA